MQKKFKRTLFIFHRDLRLQDNTTLNQALEQSEEVIPVFIFDPVQVGIDNKYRSLHAVQFMIESLEDLAEQLRNQEAKLYCFYGDTHHVVESLIKKHKVDAVASNADYTPFAQQRDKKLAALARQYDAAWLSYHDALLTYPGQVLKDNGQPYTMFTPFLRKASTHDVPGVQRLSSGKFFTGSLEHVESLTHLRKKILPDSSTSLFIAGGTTAGKAALKKAALLHSYAKTRDIPSLKTTGLSAHNKFGTISIRQVYDVFAHTSPVLVRELYWRDFFTHLAYHFPHVFKGAFNQRYDAVAWKNNAAWFTKWCEGMTGFPLVDAGMRQLAATGYMHNRVRMVVASFLTKDLHISWKWGERYFAQQLIDYDPCVNNGNWQWAASTGADAQPYFRIFNPWLQQKKFDPDARYIKTWIPELAKVAPALIHAWHKQTEPINDYPLAMVDHAEQAAYAKLMFKKLS